MFSTIKLDVCLLHRVELYLILQEMFAKFSTNMSYWYGGGIYQKYPAFSKDAHFLLTSVASQELMIERHLPPTSTYSHCATPDK